MTANAPVQPLSDVPVLDSEKAGHIYSELSGAGWKVPALAAIRDGHHVVIPVRNEEELLAMFEAQWPKDWQCKATGSAMWLACARAIQGGVK